MTITYPYYNGLYVNLTNRCDCRCSFCLRHGEKKGSIYTEDSLWLEREPTREEALESLMAWDLQSFEEIVFCGYGEPTYRVDDIIWLVDSLKSNVVNLPPIRINTNGHANLINKRDVTPDLKGRIDSLSISLNAPNPHNYVDICQPIYGEDAYHAMLDFACKAKEFVPNVTLSIVDKGLSPADIQNCREIAERLGVNLRIRSYIES